MQRPLLKDFKSFCVRLVVWDFLMKEQNMKNHFLFHWSKASGAKNLKKAEFLKYEVDRGEKMTENGD